MIVSQLALRYLCVPTNNLDAEMTADQLQLLGQVTTVSLTVFEQLANQVKQLSGVPVDVLVVKILLVKMPARQ